MLKSIATGFESLSVMLWFLWALAAAKQPNIILILTDDQDQMLGGMDHLTQVRARSRR